MARTMDCKPERLCLNCGAVVVEENKDAHAATCFRKVKDVSKNES